MNQEFLAKINEKHRRTPEVPATKLVVLWATKLMELLFPEMTQKRLSGTFEIQTELDILKLDLLKLLSTTKSCNQQKVNENAEAFFESLPSIYEDLLLDIDAFVVGDPAAKSAFEVVRVYPGVYAMFIYRVAHRLLNLHIPVIPRILSEYAHSHTGIDIHPAAIIGQSCMIDHGTGVVIGETCVIGDNVKIYQGVTLGALSIDKEKAGIKRHPTVESNVIIYSGATILGGETIIGEGSVIGGNVWLTKSIPAGTKVYHNADNRVIEKMVL